MKNLYLAFYVVFAIDARAVEPLLETNPPRRVRIDFDHSAYARGQVPATAVAKPKAAPPAVPAIAGPEGLPPMPLLKSSASLVRPVVTNYPCITLSWISSPLINNAVVQYKVIDGHVSGVPTMTNLFPASNNSVTMLLPNAAAPYWFTVQEIDSNGLACAPTTAFYNVRSNGQVYRSSGAVTLGWLATTNNTWTVQQVGATNNLYSVSPASNALEAFTLPAPLPAQWRLTRSTN